MRSLVVPLYIRLGTEFQPDDSPLTKLFRISMITQACSHEFRPCVRKAQLLFDEWMDSSDPINDNKYLFHLVSQFLSIF